MSNKPCGFCACHANQESGLDRLAVPGRCTARLCSRLACVTSIASSRVLCMSALSSALAPRLLCVVGRVFAFSRPGLRTAQYSASFVIMQPVVAFRRLERHAGALSGAPPLRPAYWGARRLFLRHVEPDQHARTHAGRHAMRTVAAQAAPAAAKVDSGVVQPAPAATHFSSLLIQDFALVQEQRVQLAPGLTVITGRLAELLRRRFQARDSQPPAWQPAAATLACLRSPSHPLRRPQQASLALASLCWWRRLARSWGHPP